MVKITDCSCECRDKGKEQQIEERALSSINKVLGTEGQAYYPDGTGAVTIPIADADDLKNAQEVPQLKISVQENTDHLETVDNVLDVHARSIKQNSDDIATLDTLTDALTKELPTDFKLYKPSSGKIQLQYETEDQSLINSNILDMVIPESYDIVSGTTSRSFKLKIQFSDGTTATTNDFVIPEGGGTSVSVTGITLTKSGNSLKASIVLDDGSTIESGTVQMVSSVEGTFANKQLVITVNGVSSVPIGIDTGGSYTAGTGIKIASGTISVDNTVVALKSDITDMETRTNANSTFATKTALASTDTKVTQIQSAVGECFTDVSISGQELTFTAVDGQTNTITLPSRTYNEVTYRGYGYNQINGVSTDKCYMFSLASLIDFDPNLTDAMLSNAVVITGSATYTNRSTYGVARKESAWLASFNSAVSNVLTEIKMNGNYLINSYNIWAQLVTVDNAYDRCGSPFFAYLPKNSTYNTTPTYDNLNDSTIIMSSRSGNPSVRVISISLS